MAVIYLSAKEYLETATDIKDKIKKLDQLINGLLDAQIAAVGGSNIDEYTLDDGQTKIQTRYTSPESITKSINSLEALKIAYTQRLTGHVFRLVDSSNFTGNRC